MFGCIESNSMGWTCHQLGNLGTFKTGGTPSSKHKEYYNGTIPFISTPSLGSDYIDQSVAKYYITDEAINNCSTELIPENSLIIGTRINIGQSSINKDPMCTNQDIVSMMNIDYRFDPLFIKHCLDRYIPFLNSQKKGATIKGITVNLLKSLSIPKPPLEKQNQYRAFVEQVDKSKAICKQIFQSFDNLVKSRFIEMFGSFEKNAMFNDFVVDMIKGPFGSDIKKSLFVPKSNDTYKVYIQGNAIRNDENLGDYYISKEYYDQKMYRFQVHPKDYIVTCDGTMGKYIRLSDDIEPGIISASLLKLTVDESAILPRFFEIQWEKEILPSLLSKVRNGCLCHLPSAKVIGKERVKLPSLEEQKIFVEFVEQVDKSKFEVVQSLLKLKDLKSSE